MKIVRIFYQDPVSFYYVRNLYCQAGSKAFGVAFNQSEDPVTEEEIISIVDEAHEQGVIEENEAEMIQNIMVVERTLKPRNIN